MRGTPRCFFLALALPRVDEAWLADFSRGLYALADGLSVCAGRGDTTRSPAGVVITITALGSVPSGSALLRSGARVGDDIWVSGELGDAALGLAVRRGEIELASVEAEAVVAASSGRCRAAFGGATAQCRKCRYRHFGWFGGRSAHVLELLRWRRDRMGARAALAGVQRQRCRAAALRTVGRGRLRTFVYRAVRPSCGCHCGSGSRVRYSDRHHNGGHRPCRARRTRGAGRHCQRCLRSFPMMRPVTARSSQTCAP